MAFRLFFRVPDLFVQGDQSTAAVSVADISCNGGGTDVDLVIRVYLGRGTTWSPKFVKGFVAVFQRGKSREIKNKKTNFTVLYHLRPNNLFNTLEAESGLRTPFVYPHCVET